MTAFWATQYTDDYTREADARQGLDFLLTQIGCLGGRLLPPSIIRRRWTVQVVFEDDPGPGAWLPDGCRRVFMIPSTIATILQENPTCNSTGTPTVAPSSLPSVSSSSSSPH